MLPPAAPPSITRAEVTRVPTGGDDPRVWANTRFDMATAILNQLGVPTELAPRVALSLLAQWAHETARGRSEFNFNLGGWHARKGDPFFTARDTLTPTTEVFRWTAYPTLAIAVDDQIRRLASQFPSAWRLLLAQPETSAWIEELGRRGYYTARPGDYARSWAMHRTELERLLF